MSTSWFQFEDGGSYVGQVDSVGRTADGLGLARGRDGRAEYAGSWNSGFEESGSFRSSSFGSYHYEGQWSGGKRNGLGVEKSGGWIYRGEWTDGLKGRYGVRQSSRSSAKYEGTWDGGLQDGYGVETSADGSTYQGQYLRGLRHGYGVRQSVTYETALVTRESFKSRVNDPQPSSADSKVPNRGSRAARVSITLNTELDFILRRHDRKLESGGGFVLTDDVAFEGGHRKFGHFLDRLGFRRTGRRSSFSGVPEEGAVLIEDFRSPQTRSLRARYSHEALNVEAGSRAVKVDDDELSLCEQKDGGLIERYFGEWKRDKRVGYGVGHRSDGLQYEGEWLNDKRNGYGRTTLPDGSRLEGKYRNNALVSSVGKAGKGPKLFTDTILEKVESAVKEAQKAADNAKQKADIALIRVSSAQAKAEEADVAAREATRHEESARYQASQTNQLNPQPGYHLTMHRINENEFLEPYDAGDSTLGSGASKGPTAGLSSLRLRMPFKRFKQPQHQPDQSFGDRKTVLPERFPWQKKKITGTTKDERIGMEKRHAEVVGSHHGDQFHLQQPAVLEMDEGGDIGPGAGVHHSLRPATSGGLHFKSRVSENIVVPQLRSTTLIRPGIEGGVGTGGGVGRKGRCDRLRKELIEAVEPSDARHPRRNSLPCIVKEKIFDSPAQLTPTISPFTAVTKPPSTSKTEDSGKTKTLQEPPKLSKPPPRQPSHTETYLIDRGVRKRVKNLYEDVENAQRSPGTRQAQKSPSFRSPATTGAVGKLLVSTMVTGFALSQSTPLRDWTSDSTTNFRKMYAFESPTLHRKTKTGSTSDVSMIKPSELLSREAVYVMSQRRREEMIQRRAEEDARRMRGEIVISVYMLQDWRILLIFFLLLFAGLVVMFRNSNHS